jgi:hypothetical protein
MKNELKSDVVDLIEHTIEDENGNKFCIKLPNDAKDVKFVDNIFGSKNRISFKTKFGGKKFMDTYVEV